MLQNLSITVSYSTQLYPFSTHTQAHTHIHEHTHTYMSTHTHTHTHMHTLTHTHFEKFNQTLPILTKWIFSTSCMNRKQISKFSLLWTSIRGVILTLMLRMKEETTWECARELANEWEGKKRKCGKQKNAGRKQQHATSPCSNTTSVSHKHHNIPL